MQRPFVLQSLFVRSDLRNPGLNHSFSSPETSEVEDGSGCFREIELEELDFGDTSSVGGWDGRVTVEDLRGGLESIGLRKERAWRHVWVQFSVNEERHFEKEKER